MPLPLGHPEGIIFMFHALFLVNIVISEMGAFR